MVILVNIADPVRMPSLEMDTEPSLPVPNVFYNDLTATSLESWFILGKSSPNGRTIQVSDIL
jgi:hypothetical protein